MTAHIKSIKSDSFVISDVEIWNTTGVAKAVDVWVKSGIVTKISPFTVAKKSTDQMIIDGHGLVLLPAGVDAQVHLRVPGQRQKETPESGLWAAVNGGVGALLTMPNTKPVLDHPSICELAKADLLDAEQATGVKVFLSAAITKNQSGRELVDFAGLARAGVVAFTDDGVGVADDRIMKDALIAAARVGLPLLQHAETPGHGGVLHECATQTKIGGLAYPASAETLMVERDLRLLAEVPDARYHVLHVSSRLTLDLVQKARSAGLHATCEASPHHLFFSADDITDGDTSFKMNPPLRSPEDRSGLVKALADGRCQFLATDHAPHESNVKTENFKTSAFGTTGLETSLRVLFWMLQRREITCMRLVEVWATAPAKFLGIDSEFGSIQVGRPLNAVLTDPYAGDRLVLESDFVGLSKNSCFKNSRLPGRLHATILREHIHTLSN